MERKEKEQGGNWECWVRGNTKAVRSSISSGEIRNPNWCEIRFFYRYTNSNKKKLLHEPNKIYVHGLNKIWGTEVCHLYTRVQCFSKCGPRTSSISIIWELIRKASSWSLPTRQIGNSGSGAQCHLITSPQGDSNVHSSLRPLH